MSEKKKIETITNTTGDNPQAFIRGPLGLWVYPILNAILAFLKSLQELKYGSNLSYAPKKKVYQLVRDDKGRIIEITEIEL